MQDNQPDVYLHVWAKARTRPLWLAVLPYPVAVRSPESRQVVGQVDEWAREAGWLVGFQPRIARHVSFSTADIGPYASCQALIMVTESGRAGRPGAGLAGRIVDIIRKNSRLIQQHTLSPAKLQELPAR